MVPPPLPQRSLSTPLVILLAVGTGVAVASIYYAQPLLPSLGQDFQASPRDVGWIPTLTQLGYGLGILLLAPLGDKFSHRTLIGTKMGVLALALVLASWATSLPFLLLASVVVGAAATVAQDIVPAAATLAPPARRGQVVGTVMMGLFLGILLSRVVSGLVAEYLGWRTVFAGAAAAVALIGAVVWWRLPRFEPGSSVGYGALLASLAHLWKEHGPLRRAAIVQGLLSVGFSAFWSTLAVMLAGPPFHLGSGVAGLFGLAGAAGALGAPIAGRWADKKSPLWVARLGAGLALGWFALLTVGAFLPPGPQLVVLVFGVVGFDLGVQMSLVAHQTVIYGLDANARSRFNAILLTAMFLGMAVGSAIASGLLAEAGWVAVMGFATAAAGAAFLFRTLGQRPGRPEGIRHRQ